MMSLFKQLQAYHTKIPEIPRDIQQCKKDTLELLEVIQKNPSIKVRSLSEQTGIMSSRIRKLLSIAKDDGYVMSTTLSSNATIWILTSRGFTYIRSNEE